MSDKEKSSRPIEFGIEIPAEGVEFEVLETHALEAERLGFDSVWLVDHLLTLTFPHGSPQADAWTTVAALLARTTRIHAGAMVFCNAFRHAPLMANSVATLDRISGGRVEFAVGAGWHEPEFVAYGYPFPPVPQRMNMLDEALQVFKQMWTSDSATFDGQFYKIKEIADCPKPVQQPHPPVWIGGVGEKRLLRLVAKHADCWNGPGLSPADLKHKNAVLDRHCAEIGRDPAAIRRTWWGQVIIDEDGETARRRLDKHNAVQSQSTENWLKHAIAGTPEECVAQFQEFIDAGVTYFVCLFGRVSDLSSTRLFAERVLPCFQISQ